MNITRGIIEKPQRVVVYGPEGIGKSTFASSFPNALFIDTEGSSEHLDVARTTEPRSWSDLMAQIEALTKDNQGFQSLIIDTADHAEKLCIRDICQRAGKNSIEDFGYGKGYVYTAEAFSGLLTALNNLRNHGMNIVLTAHSQIRKFELPDEVGAYDRYELKLERKTAPLVKEWADMLLFANYKTSIVETDGKRKAQGGRRVMYTTHRPTWDAKNRHGLKDLCDFTFSEISSFIPANGIIALKEDKTAFNYKLYDLLDEHGVSREELQAAVVLRGYYTKEVPVDNYDEKFVEKVIIANWKQVMEVINNQVRGGNNAG